MKPVPFEYERPTSLQAACQLLSDDDDAVIIAGGQTLIPMLAMRLARPSRLIDISRIDGLDTIEEKPDDITIGCMARHGAVEHSPVVASRLPLLAAAMPWVGHAPIRVRGTVGGSLANADPSAEIALVLVTLDGTVTLTSATGSRTVRAREFFAGPMMTIIEPGECLSAAHFPTWPPPGTGVGFHEIASRRSDFAMVAAAAQVTLDESGTCTACAIGIGGVTDTPLALTEPAGLLIGTTLDDAAVASAARAATQDLQAMSDPHASAAYRRRAGAKLIADAIISARSDAVQSRGGDRR
ncbi:MAG: FAD binding domain-containing protein [Hyphomicrobiaceae bacterium]